MIEATIHVVRLIDGAERYRKKKFTKEQIKEFTDSINKEQNGYMVKEVIIKT